MVINSQRRGRLPKTKFQRSIPDVITLASLLTSNPDPKDFLKFESLLRVVFHNEFYSRIGGTMNSKNAAAAPEFFLHHAFIDKIWSDWQEKGKKHKFNIFFTNQKGKMPGTRKRPKDFLDLSEQPDCICVEYVDVVNNVSTIIKGKLLKYNLV